MIRRFARPYARAIMDVVQSPEKANAIRFELARFDDLRKSSGDLQELYTNPGIEHDAKLKVTTTIAKRLALSDMTVKVLGVLIGNHRMNDLDSVSVLNDNRGPVSATHDFMIEFNRNSLRR